MVNDDDNDDDVKQYFFQNCYWPFVIVNHALP